MTSEEKKKPAIVELAEQIMASHVPFDSPTEILKIPEADLRKMYTFAFAENLKQSEISYKNKDFSNATLLGGLITTAAEYLTYTAKINNHKLEVVNALRFFRLSKKIFRESLGKDLDSYDRTIRVGALTVGLNLYGSSVKQAELSIGEWIGKSRTYVENCYTKFSKAGLWTLEAREEYFKSEEAQKMSFLINYHLLLGQLILEMSDNPFPLNKVGSASAKTHTAFNRLKADIIKYFNDNDTQTSITAEYFTMHNDEYSFEELKAALTTQN